MGRTFILFLVICLTAGCTSSTNANRGGNDEAMFGPTKMKIDPIFTQVKDWTGDGKPDGIEALIGFTDRFEDPTKAAGRVIFELYEYRRDSPDPRGKRLADPWVGSITTLNEQRELWKPVTRTYNFQMSYDQIRANRNYVLQATFELASGGRFFDKLVLDGESLKESKRVQPSSLPGAAPGGRTPQP